MTIAVRFPCGSIRACVLMYMLVRTIDIPSFEFTLHHVSFYAILFYYPRDGVYSYVPWVRTAYSFPNISTLVITESMYTYFLF